MEITRRTGLDSTGSPRAKRDIFAGLTLEIEPVEFEPKEVTKRICIFDTETDPFAQDRVVEPFTCGFYVTDTQEYFDFWGDDCIDQFFVFIRKEFEGQELVIFCHNYGNFDAYFCTSYFDCDSHPFIINGRLVRVMAGGQEFRDSYAMMPFALGTYDKIKIDYRMMEKGFRDVFRDEILIYQKRDCTALAELVLGWLDLFGDRMTIASAALPLLRSYHGFDTMTEKQDADMRPFYFGGRNQCFTTGVITGTFKVYDINSSYPNAMKRFKHPISSTPIYEAKITDRTHFAFIRAWSLGALPVRNESGGLDFPIGTRDFYACIHEIRAGLDTKTLRIIKVYHSVYFTDESNFEGFVDDMFSRRSAAKVVGDEVRRMHYKYALNSPYGKFAQDPRKYEAWWFDPEEVPTPGYCDDCNKRIRKGLPPEACEGCDGETPLTSPWGWYLHTMRNGRNIYASPQKVKPGSFFNVATAASITSAARATLLRGIQRATRPLYCDTDSIICEHLEPGDGVVLDPDELGAWDIEAAGDTVCIAGKKMYAVFNEGEEIKKASKGVRLTADQIRSVCEGAVVSYSNPVPKFSLDADPVFVTRNIRRTGNV